MRPKTMWRKHDTPFAPPNQRRDCEHGFAYHGDERAGKVSDEGRTLLVQAGTVALPELPESAQFPDTSGLGSGTKPLRFGMMTLGSEWASRMVSSAIIPFW